MERTSGGDKKVRYMKSISEESIVPQRPCDLPGNVITLHTNQKDGCFKNAGWTTPVPSRTARTQTR